MKISRIEHMCEGNGHVIIKELLDEKQLNGKCGLYAEDSGAGMFSGIPYALWGERDLLYSYRRGRV